jgi:hypothetical protein
MCQMISIQLPKSGAGGWTRTNYLPITSRVHHQLCFASMSYLLKKFGAGKENRTPILSLEGCDNTIILYPHGGETGIRTLGTGEGTTS